jgi:hypothetical protein
MNAPADRHEARQNEAEPISLENDFRPNVGVRGPLQGPRRRARHDSPAGQLHEVSGGRSQAVEMH